MSTTKIERSSTMAEKREKQKGETFWSSLLQGFDILKVGEWQNGGFLGICT